MSQAEALLNSLTQTVIDHKHEVPDSDTHFIIDPYTRQIENTAYNKTVLMRGDHNSERFTFEVPRYVDGHDMSLCNRVIVHFDNVGDSVENVYSDVAYMDDLQINPDKPDTVISSWLIRREATQIVGILSFSLQYQCVEGEEITYEWNTDSYDDIEIRKSKQNGEAAVINYTNVLEQWRSQIFGAGDSVMANITTEGANQVAAVQNESATQQAAIELKGSETLATIPDDYTEVYNMAEEALRTKADGVVCDAEGEIIMIDDASNDYVRGLNVYGKSTQFTTTGKNKLPVTAPSRTYNGITFTVRDDGGIHVKGTSAGNTWFNPGYNLTNNPDKMTFLPAGTYILSGNSNTSITGYINGWYADDETATPQINDVGKGGQVFTFDRDAYVIYQIMIAPNITIDTIVYPQLEVGETATAFEPYTGGTAAPSPDYPQEPKSIENPTVEICGKNRARSNRDGVLKSVGTTITQVNNSSEVTIDGTTTGATSVTVFSDIYLRVGQYTLSVDGLNVSGESYDRAYMMDGSTNAIVNYVQPGRPQTFTINEPKCVSISIVFAAGTSYSNRTVRFQLEEGPIATEYEPYVGITMPTTHTLHGIPVTEGGNYTDENGQQWICDEVDLERGVYIRRIAEDIVDGTTSLVHKNGDASDKYLYYHGLSEANKRLPGCCTHFTHLDAYTENPSQYGTFNLTKATAAYFNAYGLVSGDNATITDSTEFNNWFREQYEAGTPVTIYYILATPIETPLAAEEIETYKALKTNYPNTTILNNVGAWMKVKYNADTKLYIDNTSVNGAVSAVEEVLNDTY